MCEGDGFGCDTKCRMPQRGVNVCKNYFVNTHFNK